MIRSFRLQLSLWYVGFFSLLFILFGVFLYGVLSREFQNRLDERLSSEANTATALLEDELVEEKGDTQKASAEAVSGMRLRASVVAILAEGKVLAASGPLSGAQAEAIASQAPPASAAQAPSGTLIALPGLGRHGGRAAVRRFVSGQQSFLVVSAEPLDSVA